MLRPRIRVALALATVASASALHHAPVQAAVMPLQRPAGARAAPLRQVKSNLALRGGASLDAPTLFKINAAFLGFFSLQFILCPQFLTDTNFTDGRKLDAVHVWLMRGFGVLVAGFGGLITMIDADKYLGYMTAAMIGAAGSLPFYAHAWLPVRLPEHYLPVAGILALIAAHLYLWLQQADLKFDPSTVVKGFAAFLGIFFLQFLVCPQFVYETNFGDHKKLDEFHWLITRAFGTLGLFFVGLLVQLDADEYLPFITKFACVLTLAMPIYAQVNLPAKMPDHVLAVAASVAFCAALISLQYQ